MLSLFLLGYEEPAHWLRLDSGSSEDQNIHEDVPFGVRFRSSALSLLTLAPHKYPDTAGG